jgi:L-2,4-diaminobutyric acid acetyltransferase
MYQREKNNMRHKRIIYRPPIIEDGAFIWQLARDSGMLDLNSTYCYLILCRDFAKTCAVAEANGKILGFVTAYLPPDRKDTLFIWQISVNSEYRRQGIATNLIQELLQRSDICCSANYLEASIGARNQASRALIIALARKLDCGLTEQPCFPTTLFPEKNREAENFFRIGPFSLS